MTFRGLAPALSSVEVGGEKFEVGLGGAKVKAGRQRGGSSQSRGEGEAHILDGEARDLW